MPPPGLHFPQATHASYLCECCCCFPLLKTARQGGACVLRFLVFMCMGVLLLAHSHIIRPQHGCYSRYWTLHKPLIQQPRRHLHIRQPATAANYLCECCCCLPPVEDCHAGAAWAAQVAAQPALSNAVELRPQLVPVGAEKQWCENIVMQVRSCQQLGCCC
jgi:hypothetical protein